MFDVPIHKLIVHFPIALMIIATLYDAWAVYTRKPELHRTGYGLTLWAAVGALAAAASGLQLADMIHIDKGAVTGHAGFGITSAILIAALAGIRYSAQANEQKDYKVGWLVLEVAAAVLICATALTGHRL
ncbi:MAG TPA: DUF2231 domain-containing protein [Terriglobia bacterium]|nr:DUF2231 domain-containing protein [Terriglobia bacterium]